MTGPSASPTPEFDTTTMAALIARRIVLQNAYDELLRALCLDPKVDSHEDAVALCKALVELAQRSER